MSKGELSESGHGDIVTDETQQPAHDLTGDDESRSEAPTTKAPPGTKAPPAAPKTTVPDRSVATVPSKRRWRPSLRLILMAGGTIIVVIGTFAFWLQGGRYASTDDAYVDSAKVLVTTDVSGLVSTVNVHEGEQVKAGQLLFQVDPLQFQIALNNAKDNLNEVALTIQSMKDDYQALLSDVSAQQAQVALDQVTFERDAALVADVTVTRQVYDQVRYTLQLDKAKLLSLQQQAQVQLAKLAGNVNIAVTDHPLYRQAQAEVDEAQRQLNHTSVRAPFDGVATQVDSLQPGTYLVAQTAAETESGAIALVSTTDVWVTAQMKETDLTYVKLGDHVDVSVDTYPGRTFDGVVQSVSPAAGSEFSVIPAQNTSGNWVKVVQRIPLKIRIQHKADAPIFRAGMSVYVSVDTGHKRTLSDLF
jgi:membrane fusion protein (multidrug efflux system)